MMVCTHPRAPRTEVESVRNKWHQRKVAVLSNSSATESHHAEFISVQSTALHRSAFCLPMATCADPSKAFCFLDASCNLVQRCYPRSTISPWVKVCSLFSACAWAGLKALLLLCVPCTEREELLTQESSVTVPAFVCSIRACDRRHCCCSGFDSTHYLNGSLPPVFPRERPTFFRLLRVASPLHAPCPIAGAAKSGRPFFASAQQLTWSSRPRGAKRYPRPPSLTAPTAASAPRPRAAAGPALSCPTAQWGAAAPPLRRRQPMGGVPRRPSTCGCGSHLSGREKPPEPVGAAGCALLSPFAPASSRPAGPVPTPAASARHDTRLRQVSCAGRGGLEPRPVRPAPPTGVGGWRSRGSAAARGVLGAAPPSPRGGGATRREGGGGATPAAIPPLSLRPYHRRRAAGQGRFETRHRRRAWGSAAAVRLPPPTAP